MHRAAPPLSRVIAAIALAAVAASGAAAAGNMFIRLHDVAGEDSAAAGRGHGEQIEVQSFQWGAATAAGPMKPVFVKSWSTSGDANASGEWIADVERPAAPARRGTGANQMSMDDTAGKEKARRGTGAVGANETITVGGGRTESDPDRPVIAGTVPNASAGKRQHGAVTTAKEWGAATPQLTKPQDNSSVWIRVATPWAACRVGTRYPVVELGDGKARYKLSGAVVTACDAGGVSLNYAKVTVRGWDPAKKEE